MGLQRVTDRRRDQERSVRNQRSRPHRGAPVPHPRAHVAKFKQAGADFHQALAKMATVESVIRRAVSAGVFSQAEVDAWEARIDAAEGDEAKGFVAFRLATILTSRLERADA